MWKSRKSDGKNPSSYTCQTCFSCHKVANDRVKTFKEHFKRSTNKRHFQVVLTVFFSLSVLLCGADIYIFHSFDIKKHERKNWTLPPSQALHFKDKLTWAKGQLSNNTLYCLSVIGLLFTAFEGKGQFLRSCFPHLFIIFYRIGYEEKKHSMSMNLFNKAISKLMISNKFTSDLRTDYKLQKPSIHNEENWHGNPNCTHLQK